MGLIKDKKKGLIDPKGNFMLNWDVVMMVLLIFTALVTPFEVAFLETKIDGLFCINRLVDLGFLIDMFINFRLIFEDISNKSVTSKTRIAQKYLKGWFTID